MKFPYDESYWPAFPAAYVVVSNAEADLRTERAMALLDTGSDGSLVPIALLREVLAPPIAEARIRSHWGEWRRVQLFVVDIELNGFLLPGVIVVGDDQGDEIVLGRDVLNKFRLLLDGPAASAEILG